MIIKEPNVKCGYCEVEFYRIPSKMKSKSGIYFCCREHQGLGFKKDSGINVTSGPITRNSYKEPRFFNCLNCKSKIKETLTNKTFCNIECKELYTTNLFSKECASCHEVKIIGKFHKNTNSFDGYRKICIECNAEAWKNWYEIDRSSKREKNNVTNKIWSKTTKGQEAVLKKD